MTLPAREALGDRALRVASYNLYLGADLTHVFGLGRSGDPDADLAEVLRQLGATAFERRVGAVAAVLADARPDLVGLQEVCQWWVDGELVSDYADLLVAALAGLGAAYEVVTSEPTFRGGGRFPASLDLPWEQVDLAGRNVLLRRLDGPARVVRTVGGAFADALVTPIVRNDDVRVLRSWCGAVCEVGGREVLCVTTHTEAYSAEHRDAQRQQLLREVGALPLPQVLLGDFNAPPAEVDMPAPWVDAWVAAGHDSEDPAGHTCCQDAALDGAQSALRERIDYVWVRGLEVTACARRGGDAADRTPEGMWPSDHAAVVADLVVP